MMSCTKTEKKLDLLWRNWKCWYCGVPRHPRPRSCWDRDEREPNRVDYNDITINEIDAPPPPSGEQCTREKKERIVQVYYSTQGSIHCKKKNLECFSPQKPAYISALSPYKECVSPSTKRKKEEKNPKTESKRPTQSVDDTQHEQKQTMHGVAATYSQ